MHFINLNGKVIPENEGTLPATSRSVFYGDGCFDTLRSYNGEFLHFDEHFERLQAGLSYLEMSSGLTKDQLKYEIDKVIDRNDLRERDSVIRIQCFREGKSGYFDLSEQSGFLISHREIGNTPSELTLKTSSIRAIPSESLERKVKLSNSINYIKAAQEAQKDGFDDALMLTVNNDISETTISNIFWIRGNQIFTPSVNCDLLPGITRSIVTKLIEQNDELSLEEGKYELDKIYDADTVFCVNSVIELKGVYKIDDRVFDTRNPIIADLKRSLAAYKEFNLK